MADKKDYYDSLGVSKSANPDEIKAAYRRQAIKFHPDKNPGDKNAESQFKTINEAYEVLSDPQKRAAYDRFGHAGAQAGGFPGGAGGYGGGFSDLGDIDLGDILGNIFGGGGDVFSGSGRRSRTSRGQDVAVETDVTLRQAYQGINQPITVRRAVACDVCKGTGAKPGSTPHTCKTCGGAGQVRSQRGFFVMQTTCPSCHGDGQTISSPCSPCHGNGAVEKTSTVTVRIPPGVREGTSLRISGSGQAGPRGGATGDLYVVIHVEKDPHFTREDDDLYSEVHVSIPQAVMGCEIPVKTMEEPVTMKIPPGTQSGTLFRLRERGMPHLAARGQGDLFVKAVVDIPKHLSDEQRRLLREFAKSLGEDPTHYDESVLKKIFG